MPVKKSEAKITKPDAPKAKRGTASETKNNAAALAKDLASQQMVAVNVRPVAKKAKGVAIEAQAKVKHCGMTITLPAGVTEADCPNCGKSLNPEDNGVGKVGLVKPVIDVSLSGEDDLEALNG